MDSKFDSDIVVDANNAKHRGDCTNPVLSKPSTRQLAAAARRLGAWITAGIKAHEDRVFALRVYSQRRQDRRIISIRKDA